MKKLHSSLLEALCLPVRIYARQLQLAAESRKKPGSRIPWLSFWHSGTLALVLASDCLASSRLPPWLSFRLL